MRSVHPLWCICITAALLPGGAAAQVCESGSPLTGSAANCAVFQIGTGKVSMSHGDPTGVDGDLCMAAFSKLSMSGGQIITGTAFLEPGVDYPDDLFERAGAVELNADLSSGIADATAASAALAALPCDVTVGDLKIEEPAMLDVRDFVPGGGQAVVCVDGKMEVKGSGTTLLLSGEPGDSFVFNISEDLKVNGAKIFAAGSLSPSDIVYNLPVEGSTVAFSGGGGGIGCCKAELEGTILAPEGKMAISPGKVTGQLISGRDISLASGSLVTCPPGVPAQGAIGDRVWEDSFSSGVVGVQDPGEAGLNGITVRLFDSAMNLITTQDTSGDGNYLFTGLAAGTYVVEVDSTQSPIDLYFQTFDFDGTGTPHRATVTIGDGEVNLEVDFGYAPGR